jgi:hypothetical protein
MGAYAVAVGLVILAFAIYFTDPLLLRSANFYVGSVYVGCVSTLFCVTAGLLIVASVFAKLTNWRAIGSAMVVLSVGAAVTFALLGFIQTISIQNQISLQQASSNSRNSLRILSETESQGVDVPSVVSSQNQALLGLFGTILALGAIGVTVLGFWFQAQLGKITELDKRMDEVSRFAVVAVESTLLHLPPPSESQQIPEGVMRTLALMNRLVFEDPDRALLSYLETHGLGDRLHLAKGVYEYGRGHFFAAHQELQKMQPQRLDKDLVAEVSWFHAMLLRQMGKYPDSARKLQEMDPDMPGNETLQSQFLVGHALRLITEKRRS